MTARLTRCAYLSLLVLLALPRLAYAVDDIFVLVNGIQGDATDRDHPGWIQVYALGNSVASLMVTNGGSQRTETQFSDLSVLKKIDRASPALFVSAASARQIPTVKIEFVRPGPTPFAYFKMELSDVLITGVRTNANSAEDSISEFVTFSYDRIKWEFIPQNPDGSAGTSVKGCWDRSEDGTC